MAETPGYSDILTILHGLGWRLGTPLPKDPIVLKRLVEFAARRVKESGGTESYAHHFREAFRSTYGYAEGLSAEEQNLVSGLIECYVTPGTLSDVENVPLEGMYWDHFKGGFYRTNRLERDADTGKMRVSYDSIDHGTPHSRRVEQWNEVVEWPDGKYRSRFVLRGPAGTPEPPYKVRKA